MGNLFKARRYLCKRNWIPVEAIEWGLGEALHFCIGRHDGLSKCLGVVHRIAERGLQCRESGDHLVAGKRHADDAG